MAKDYDTPRKADDEVQEDSFEELQSRRQNAGTSSLEDDENEVADAFELPGADLSGEELSVRVLPKQDDEFTCSMCFLVHHISQMSHEENGQPICSDCAFLILK